MQGAQAGDKGPRSDVDISNQIEWKAIERNNDCEENKIGREFEEVWTIPMRYPVQIVQRTSTPVASSM